VKYFSVCSGIEVATVAWRPLGWKAVGFSEIEPFPAHAACGDRAHHAPFDTTEMAGARMAVGGRECCAALQTRHGFEKLHDLVGAQNNQQFVSFPRVGKLSDRRSPSIAQLSD
jgi:site-specific DNA-cytosine methylase